MRGLAAYAVTCALSAIVAVAMIAGAALIVIMVERAL